jgi:hypothetical protein
MRPISNRPFLKRTRPTGRRPANRRVRAGACAVGKVSPHVSWTSRITEKLARRTPWLGINPEAMILACVARPWILLRQTVLRQIQAGTPTSPASPKEHKGPRSNESNHWLKAQSPLAILRHLAGEPIPSSTARLMLESARNCVPQPAIFSTRLRRNSAVEFAEKPAGLQRTRPLHGDAIPSRALLLSLANRILVRRRPVRQEEVTEEVRVNDVSTRVMRKHRRVEERPFMRVRDLTGRLAPAPAAENPVVIERPRPRLAAKHKPSSELEPRNGVSQADRAVNMAQVTDEVLRQLDRRLVAARERRGRI